MGAPPFWSFFNSFRTPGRVTGADAFDGTDALADADAAEDEAGNAAGFRGHGATDSFEMLGSSPQRTVGSFRGTPLRIPAGSANIGMGGFPMRVGIAPDDSEIPTGLAPGVPAPVNALPPAANSFEEQVRASMFGRTGQQPPIPMRTGDSPQMPASPAPAARMRAIRLPNGQFLFTNREELGGEEFSTEDAGLIGRADQARQLDPASDTARALVARATEAEGRGRTVAGEAPDTSGAASFIEGTPEIQRELALEDALGGAALAEAQSAREFAELPIDRRAMLSNPDLVAGATVTRDLDKRLKQAMQEAEIARQEISTPGHPRYVADERARQAALMDIEERRRIATDNALAVGSLMMGRSVPQRGF